MKPEIKINTDQQPPAIDSRDTVRGFSFDEENSTFTLKSKNGDMVFSKEELLALEAELGEAINIASSVPHTMYPAEQLVKSDTLCDVILSNESMREFMFGSDSLANKEYLDDLHEKRFRQQDLPISRRVFNDWLHDKKLLTDRRENLEQWHTFSKIDLAYIRILKTCRDFGTSIRKLAMARDSLFTKLNDTNFSLLEIAYTCFDKQEGSGDIYLIMDKIGRCNVVRAADIILMTQDKMISNHFILNLSRVWNEKA